jgi:mannosyltransferase
MGSGRLLSNPIGSPAGGIAAGAGPRAELTPRLRIHRLAWAWTAQMRIALLSLAGLATGSLFVGRHSLWLDETFSIAYSRSSTPELWHRFGLEINMALYHGALHFWLLLGTGATTVRMLSVLFAVATVPVLYLLVRRLYGDTRATVACALLVVNPFYVQYAQEARAYSLALLFATGTTYLFVRAVQTRSRAAWTAYALAAGLATYAHLFLALVIVAHAVSLCVASGRPRVRRRAVALSFVSAALLAAPVLYLADRQAPGHAPVLPRPSAADLLSVFMLGSGETYSGAAVILFVLALSATVVFMVGARGTRRSGSAWADGLVLSWFVVPVAIGFAASFARSTFAPRYLIVSMPALLIMAAVVVVPAGRHRLVLPALAAVLALSFSVDWAYYHDRSAKEDWRGLAAYLVSASRPGDGLIVYQPYLRTPLDYYLLRHAGPLPVTPIYPSLGYSATDAFASGPDVTAPATARRLDRAAGRHGRVWIVLETNLERGGRTSPGVRSILASVKGRRLLVDRDYRRMVLLLYGRRRGTGA